MISLLSDMLINEFLQQEKTISEKQDEFIEKYPDEIADLLLKALGDEHTAITAKKRQLQG